MKKVYQFDVEGKLVKIYDSIYQKYKDKPNSHQFCLRFSEDGIRKTIGYFKTYEEAENKYRELYNERQMRINARSKVLTIDN